MASSNLSRARNKLTAKEVENAVPAGDKRMLRLSDGGGLTLMVSRASNGFRRYWQFRYSDPVTGKAQTASLGTFPDLSLEKARRQANTIRQDLRKGISPKDRERQRIAELAAERRDRANTFQSVTEAWYEEWTSDRNGQSKKYEDVVWQSFELHVLPHIGNLAIKDVSASDIKSIIRRIGKNQTWETCQRVLHRIKTVFQWAVDEEIVVSIPTGPAQRWIKQNRPEETKECNYPSLPPNRLGELIHALNNEKEFMNRQTYLALRLLMLTFVRPGELRHAEWGEFDFQNALWEIPAEKMKRKRPHLVPLSPQALEILEELQVLNGHRRWVFPGHYRPRNPMSEGTLNMAIKRLKPDANGIGYFVGKHTAHGFRSTASTFLNEYRKGDARPYHGDPVELQLAHLDKNMIRRRYDKATHLELRREMMDVWASYCDECTNKRASVTPINQSVMA